ncbi:CDP-alcohol phosphatidyltransferase family protein [Candidatus Korobacter versatilis]|nr:CDP-alcohol phosphatidyltransferase family protein [Candidatus Koribacter versatilis]
MPKLTSEMKQLIPWSMTLGRVLFAPIVIWLALTGRSGWWISACIVAEVVLDIFDGIVARRLGVATPLLRRMDSVMDTIFYLAILYIGWKVHYDVLWERRWLLAGLIAMELLRYSFDYLKFRREAAYHMYSSKAWGLLLGAAVIALLGFNISGWLLSAALVVGILCDVEGLVISWLLYESVEDVPHIARALQLRREQRQRRRSTNTFAATAK